MIMTLLPQVKAHKIFNLQAEKMCFPSVVAAQPSFSFQQDNNQTG